MLAMLFPGSSSRSALEGLATWSIFYSKLSRKRARLARASSREVAPGSHRNWRDLDTIIQLGKRFQLGALIHVLS
jgi:hypothetical protein